MRAISNNEINSVTGAGYSEDIITAAATIYVGRAIGGAASAISYGVFAGAASVIGMFTGLAPLAAGVTAIGGIVSPIVSLAAPVLAFDKVYPGVIAEKVAPYLK